MENQCRNPAQRLRWKLQHIVQAIRICHNGPKNTNATWIWHTQMTNAFSSVRFWSYLASFAFFSSFQQRQWRNQIVSLGEDKGTSPLKMCHNGIASGPARGVCWRWETCVTYDHNIGLVLLCKFIVTIWYIFYYINVRHNMYTLFKRPFEYKWWYISIPIYRLWWLR